MDGYSVAERTWLKETGEPYVERAENGAGAAVLGGVVFGGNGQSAACWSFVGGQRMDVALRTGWLRDRRFLPLPMLYHHWFALRTTLHDDGAAGGSFHGVDYVRSADDDNEYRGHAGDALWYQHLHYRFSGLYL